MTTAAFRANQPAAIAAMTQINALHCKTPSMRPAETVRSQIRCTKCKSTLAYTVSAVDGAITFRCLSACGLRWGM